MEDFADLERRNPVPKSSIAELIPKARSCPRLRPALFAVLHHYALCEFKLESGRRQTVLFQGVGNMSVTNPPRFELPKWKHLRAMRNL